jgi:hypothetical protein
MILKTFSPKQMAKKMRIFDSKQSKIVQNLIITLFFDKKRQTNAP